MPLHESAVIPVPTSPEKLCKEHIGDVYESDSDLLSHSDMSWGSLQDRYVPYEILSDKFTSSSSSSSALSSSSSVTITQYHFIN